MNNIPNHWELFKFEDLLEYIQPTPYIVESTEYSDDYETPVLTAGKSFVLGKTNEVTGIFNLLPVIIFDDFTTAIKFVNFPFKVKSSAIKILKPKAESVNIKFVYYYMQTVHVTNNTHKRYWISVFSKLSIPLPTKDEQLAIVSKIEELFSDLENGKQQLLLAQQQLKVYRQSLLKWAFEGRLTNKNVKDGELPKDWNTVELREVTENITDGEHFRPQTQEDGIPFLSAKDIRDDGVSFDEPLFISEETAKKAMQRCNPKRGDILIVSRGATVGRMCIVNTDKQFCLLGSVILIKVNKTVNSKLLNHILKSPIANQKMIAISGATAQQAIYLRDIKTISIPLPPIEEQQHIMDELDSKLTVCDKIEETISQSLKQAETLRQSILKKAFEGKLI